jgi:hypothetical protein
MTYPTPRDNVYPDPSGAVTTAPGESYYDEQDRDEELQEQTANAGAAEEDDEGAEEARAEEARATEGDEDDDAEIDDAPEAHDTESHDGADLQDADMSDADTSDDVDARDAADRADEDGEAVDDDELDDDDLDADVAMADDEEDVADEDEILEEEGRPGDASANAATYAEDADTVADTADETEAVHDDAFDGQDVDFVPVGVAPVVTPDPVLSDEPVNDATPADSTEVVGVLAGGATGVASGLHPGEADVPVAGAALANSDGFRDRWQQAQLGFIDDPRAAAESARSLAAEVLEAHITTLRDRQQQLDAWQTEATPDTEVLRAAIRAYRDMITSLVEE